MTGRRATKIHMHRLVLFIPGVKVSGVQMAASGIVAYPSCVLHSSMNSVSHFLLVYLASHHIYLHRSLRASCLGDSPALSSTLIPEAPALSTR